MSARFSKWGDAHDAAVRLACQIGHDVGIWRQEEFGKDGYNIRSLPRPENRYGHELRCEVASPTDPLRFKFPWEVGFDPVQNTTPCGLANLLSLGIKEKPRRGG